jgi:CBS-domain-containing membrane protein
VALATAAWESRTALFPVVDDAHHLLGLLWRPDVAPPHLRVTIQQRLRKREGLASEVMDTRGHVAFESTPLLEAFQRMTVDRARFLTVLSADGGVVGMLSDLDLLGWFARARRGEH